MNKDYVTRNEFNAKFASVIGYSVGKLYMTTTEEDPAELFGGSWEKIQGRVLLGASSSYAVKSTGGSADAVVVSHNHSLGITEGFIAYGANYGTWGSGGNNYSYRNTNNHTQYEGVDGTGKNMPPYFAVNIWHRYG